MSKVAADKSVHSYKLTETDKFIVKNVVHWRMKFHFEGPLTGASGDLTKLRRRRQGERQKNNGFNKKNNKPARVSRRFVHFFAVPAQLRHERTKF